MSKHLDWVHKNVGRSQIRVSAEAFGCAVAMTDEELLVGKAGLLSRWSKIERYPLSGLRILRVVPNPSASLVQLEFEGSGTRQVLAIMYGPESAAAFAQIIEALARGPATGKLGEAEGGADGQKS